MEASGFACCCTPGSLKALNSEQELSTNAAYRGLVLVGSLRQLESKPPVSMQDRVVLSWSRTEVAGFTLSVRNV